MSSLALQRIKENIQKHERGEDASFLDLGACGMEIIPDLLGSCVWLEELLLSDSYIDMQTQSGYQTINVGSPNIIKVFPDCITQLKQLKKIVAAGRRHSDETGILAENFELLGELPQLKFLYIQDTLVEDLAFVSKLENLCVLNISETYFLKNIAALKHLSKLEYLDISASAVSDLSPLSGLSNLKVLGCSSSLVKDISPINSLNIEELAIGGLGIRDFSPLITLTNLRHFHCFGDNFDTIEYLKNAQKLTKLDCPNTSISEITFISEFKKLEFLNLSKNKVQDLSPLESCKKLKTLLVDNNKIRDIKALISLKHLEILDISSNEIQEIAPVIQLKALKELFLEGNPIIDCPEEYWQTGDIKVIRGYFKGQEREAKKIASGGSVPEKPREVKLILVGNSSVGKTQLREYFSTGNIRKPNEHDSTHGIEVSTWIKNKKGRSKSPLNSHLPENFYVNIWDFGGQEYYHGTHRLFLAKQALYVLVWDVDSNRNNFSESEAGQSVEHFNYEYWLENIRYYAAEAPILLLQNKADDIESMRERISNKNFETHRSLKESFCISLHETYRHQQAKHKRLFDNFCEETCSQLQKIANSKPYTAEQWDIREKLREASLDPENPFYVAFNNPATCAITVNEFSKICGNINRVFRTKSEEFWALITWLEFTGTIIYYANNPKLSDQIFLKPKEITNSIYQILKTDVLSANGVFCKSDIPNITGDVSVFLDLMEEMEIIFPDPLDPEKYIVPQYLPSKHPIEDLFAIAEAGITQFSYKVRVPLFFYRKLMAHIIFYLGAEADVKAKYFWKHGVVFMTQQGTRCVIKGMYPSTSEGVILVGVEEGDERSVIQEEIFDQLLIILSNQEKQARNMAPPKALGRRIKSNMKPQTQPERKRTTDPWRKNLGEGEHLRWFEVLEVAVGNSDFYLYKDILDAANKNELKFYQPGKKTITIKDFEIFLDQKVKRPLKVFISYANSEAGLMGRLKAHLSPLMRSEKIETWTDQEILPGTEWDDEIQKKLNASDIVLLLLSADFVASEYIWNKELKNISGKTTVIQILLQPLDLHGLDVLKDKNMIPFFYDNNKKGARQLRAITLWENIEMGFAEVAKHIRQAVDNILEGKEAFSEEVSEEEAGPFIHVL